MDPRRDFGRPGPASPPSIPPPPPRVVDNYIPRPVSPPLITIPDSPPGRVPLPPGVGRGPPPPPPGARMYPPQPPPPLPPPTESNLTVKSTISQDRTKGKGAFRSQLLAILQEHGNRSDGAPLLYPPPLPGGPPPPPPGQHYMGVPPIPRGPPVIIRNTRRRRRAHAPSRSTSRSRSSSPTGSDLSASERDIRRRRRRRRQRRRSLDLNSTDDSYVSSYSDTIEEKKRSGRARSEKSLQKTPDVSPRGERTELKPEEPAAAPPTGESTKNEPSPASDLPTLAKDDLQDPEVSPPSKKEPKVEDDAQKTLAERMRKNVEELPNISLYDDSPESRLFGRLLETIKKLELERDHVAREFRAYRRGSVHSDESGSESDVDDLARAEGAPSKIPEIQPKYEIHHSVECDEEAHRKSNYGTFRDQPALYAGDDADAHLQGKDEIKNPRRYLDANKSIVFVVEREYMCRHYQGQLDDERNKGLIDRFDRLKRDGPKANVNLETIKITNMDLLDLLNNLILENRELFPNYQLFDTEIPAPYLFFYHHRKFLEEQANDTEDPRKRLLAPLLAFVKETYQAEWDEADALFAKGETTQKHITKLFRPGDIVISRREGKLIGYEVAQWPRNIGPLGGASVACTNYMFHGYFFKSSHSLGALPPMKERFNNSAFPIDKLDTYPLRFCAPGTEEELIRRGKQFWSVRNRSFISYSGWDFDGEERFINTRFMVDFMTYKRMHPREASIMEPPTHFRLSPEEMNKDEPPEGNFVLLLPANVYGFNLLDKKWINLSVDQISPIEWNKKAFERLVVKPKIKELIKALVTVHITMGKSADIVTGKGNGLIVLLHGGPGTGKTLTAESVAELAEKPLYRVTCGDIGTNPEAIEKYLETVLYIGELWGCVVLLDEADVFLEERSLADLERNAMVSVFLRVLEYYEGILVLTSNRVGTFDEAFKSRIQLALHYPNLSETDRRKIWNNFIKALAEVEENVDIADLEDRVDDLAKHKMNGRQIRNAVTTARQLAQYRKQTLDYGHFEHVISTMIEFDQYLEKTHRHTDDQWAREEGVRY